MRFSKSTIPAVAGAVLLAAMSAPLAQAQAPEQDPVCDADQVLPGLGFLPITFSRFVARILGVDPDECQTPVEPLE